MATGRASARSGTKAAAVVVVAPAVQIKSVLFTVGTMDLIVSGTVTVVK